MEQIRFTILICTRDRCDSLIRCLQSLQELCAELSANQWEVLVVDNGSSDGTADAVTSLAADYPLELRLITEPRTGIAFARNAGMSSARGEFLAIADDDVTFTPGWARAWVDVFADPEVVAAAAPIEPVFPEGAEPWFARGVLMDGASHVGHYDAGSEVLVRGPEVRFNLPYTGNSAVRRSTGLEVGGFREDLGYRGQSGRSRISGEDKEFFQRVEATGGKILYTPHARVFHHLRPEHMTMEYYRRWHRGYGTATERMRPGHSIVRNFFKFLEQSGQYLFYGLRLCLPGQARNFRAHRKQSQALGRLDQLLGR